MLGNITDLALTTTTALVDILEVVGGFVLDHWKEGSIAVVIGLVVRWYLQKRHKDLIYNWLFNETKHCEHYTIGSPYDTPWRSTEEISAAVDLPEDRVKYICTIHKDIQRQIIEGRDTWGEQPSEKWAIRKFVRR